MTDDENLGDLGTLRSDYAADLDWAGCRNCGHPINITVPVRRFALDVLYHLGQAAEQASSDTMRETISTLSAECWSQVLSAHYDDFILQTIIEAGEKARQEARRTGKKRRGGRARAT